MKNKYSRIIPFALSAALLTTACAAYQAESSAADPLTPGTETLLTVSGTDAAGTTVLQTASVTGTSDTAETGSGLFSDRDLSGDYDASEAVSITLNGTGAQADSDAVVISDSAVTITAEGTYILSGALDNGSIIVDADKEAKVQLVLDGVTINSDTFAAIYVLQADKVFVTLEEGTENSLSNGGSFVQIDDNDVDAVIYAKDDITFNGTGSLRITSPAGHGIVGKDEVTFTGGTYEISAADNAVRAKDSIAVADGNFTLTAEDGLHAENPDDETLGSIYITGGQFYINASDDAVHANTLLQIDGGSLDLTGAEGLEATCITVNDGDINISASDDGVNAAYKSSAYTPTVEINGGTLTIVMGSGDTDAIDSNSDVIISGGTIDITGNSAFDYDGTAQYNGGTIIINGQTVNSIPNQLMGGGMSGMGGMGGMGGMNNMNGMNNMEGMNGRGHGRRGL